MAKKVEEGKVEILTKEERINKSIEAMEKKFGKGSVMGAQDKPTSHEHVSTGSLGLDRAIGIGGLPKGRIVEFIGWESSGKTTLAIHTIAEAHRDPESYCAFVDVEHAFDTHYAKLLGVDLKRLKISQPNNAEEALEIAEAYAETGDYDVVVVDSVAALVPKSEVDGEMGDQAMGKQARLMGQAMRKLTPVVSKSGTLMIFINQKREKIGVMFGSPETTPGGNALKFYASVRLDISRQNSDKGGTSIKDGEDHIGNQVTVKVIKNKVSPPFKKCSFDVLYGVGIDKVGEIMDIAEDSGIIVRGGAYYSYDGNRLGMGRNAILSLLRDNTELFEEIKSKVLNTFVPKEIDIVDVEQMKKDGEIE